MKLSLSVKTPLVIGGDEEIQEFDLFEKDGNAYVVDTVKTSMRISDRDSKRWQDLIDAFVRGKGNTGKWDHYRDFRKVNQGDEIQLFLRDLYDSKKLELFDPPVKLMTAEYRNNGPIIPTIHYIDRNGVNDRIVPYIPGSTIKGAIRKAILYELIKKGSSLQTRNGQRRAIDILKDSINKRKDSKDSIYKRKDSKNIKDIDRGIFSYDPKNPIATDIMRFLVVSDFMPSDDVNLGLFRVSGKVRSDRVKRVYLGIISGTFYGDLSINRSIIPAVQGVLRTEQIDRLEKILGINMDPETKNIKSWENGMVKWVLESLDIFSRENGQPMGYKFDKDSKYIVIGQGKGAPLTTIINASPEIIRIAKENGIKRVGRGTIDSIANPKSRSEVETPTGKVRPGLCTMEVLNEIRTD